MRSAGVEKNAVRAQHHKQAPRLSGPQLSGCLGAAVVQPSGRGSKDAGCVHAGERAGQEVHSRGGSALQGQHAQLVHAGCASAQQARWLHQRVVAKFRLEGRVPCCSTVTLVAGLPFRASDRPHLCCGTPHPWCC